MAIFCLSFVKSLLTCACLSEIMDVVHVLASFKWTGMFPVFREEIGQGQPGSNPK
jgi:hypothetical protein